MQGRDYTPEHGLYHPSFHSRRSLSSSRASEMLFLRDSGLLGRTLPHSLSTSLHFPPPASPKGLLSVYVAVVRAREQRLLRRVLGELKLEIVLGGLADRYYANRLKYRLFRSVKIAVKLPQGTLKIDNLVRNRGWKRYRKRVKVTKAEEMWTKRLRKIAINWWKRWVKLRQILQERQLYRLYGYISSWRLGSRIAKLEKQIKYREMGNVIREWKQNSEERREIRVYFRAFCSICKSKHSNRIAKDEKIKILKEKMQTFYRIRIKTLIFKRFKEFFLAKSEAKVESLLRFDALQRNFARRLLSTWHSYSSRTLFPILIQRKVFKAARFLLKRTHSARLFTAKRHQKQKKSHFREWLELIQSGKFRLIQAAEKLHWKWTVCRAIRVLKSTAEEGYRLKSLGEDYRRQLLLLKVWKTVYEYYSFSRGRRYYQAFMRYRLVRYVAFWHKYAKKSAQSHRDIIRAMQRNRVCRVMRKWQLKARSIRLIEAQKASNFLKNTRIKRLFALLKLEIDAKRLVTHQLFRTRQVVQAWREVTKSLQAYRSRAMTLSIPNRLKIKRKAWKIEDLEAKKIREQATKRGLKVLKAWKIVTLREIRIENMHKRREIKVKSLAFAMLFQLFYSAFRCRLSLNHSKKRLFGGYFSRWNTAIQLIKRTFIAKKVLSNRKAQFAIAKMQLFLINSEACKRYWLQALKYREKQGKINALRRLFVHAKKGFEVKFARAKVLAVRKPELLSKAMKGFREYVGFRRIEKKIRDKNRGKVVKSCFSALLVHKITIKAVKCLKMQCLKRFSKEILSIWGNIAGIMSALKDLRPEVAAYLACNQLPSALKLVSSEYQTAKQKKSALNWLRISARNRKETREKLENKQNITKIAKIKEILCEWRLDTRRKAYKRRRLDKQRQFTLIKLQRNRKIHNYLRLKRLQLLKGLFLSWENAHTPSSLSPFLSYPASLSFFRRPEKHQIFSVWHRKTRAQIQLQAWANSKEKRLTAAVWTIMKRVKEKLVLERERTFQLQKDLIMEIKRLFRSQRLANLFRRRKLGVKAVKAWRIDTVSQAKFQETESVYLYCPIEQESICKQFQSPESLIDSQQLDLETELSLLTAQLNPCKSSQMALQETALGLTSKPAVSRKVMEEERAALGMYAEYRQEMRTVQRRQPLQGGRGSEAEERHRRVSDIIQTRKLPKAVQEVWELEPRAKPTPHPWR